MLPKRWRANRNVQTIFLLLTPFLLDYLLVTEVIAEVKIPLIPMIFYIGMHSIFLIDYLNFSFPEWMYPLKIRAIFLKLTVGGLAGFLTLNYEQTLSNIFCGASALFIVLANISYLQDAIDAKVMLRAVSFSTCLLSITGFILHEHKVAFALIAWSAATLVQSCLVPAGEYRSDTE